LHVDTAKRVLSCPEDDAFTLLLKGLYLRRVSVAGRDEEDFNVGHFAQNPMNDGIGVISGNDVFSLDHLTRGDSRSTS